MVVLSFELKLTYHFPLGDLRPMLPAYPITLIADVSYF
jgi:hypothetical protein